MKLITLKLEDIKPYEKNPRMNDNAVDEVMKSIEQYGYRSRIIVDKNNVIIAGHTRKRALEKLGWKEAEVWCADDLTDEQVRALRIADNKTSDFSMWDNKLLLEELEYLKPYELYTGFEYTSFSDAGELDEGKNGVITENTDGVYFEVVFKSEDRSKIEKIKELWEQINEEGEEDEEDFDSGDFGEETGELQTAAY